jgi:hypothetical protein
MGWIIKFSLLSFGGIAAALVVAGMTGVFDGLGIGTSGMVAMAVGAFFTCALAVALMALIFYSARSDQDEAVYHPTVAVLGDQPVPGDSAAAPRDAN